MGKGQQVVTISKRAKDTPASAIRKLTPLANEAKKRGIKVYHLNIGQPDLPTPDEILDFFRHCQRKTLDYAPSQGIEEVILAWKEFYSQRQMEFEKSEIMVTSGGSESLIFAFFATCDPGEEILVLEPFYTSYAIDAAMGNIRLKPVTTRASDGFHLPDRVKIEQQISQKTRAILICNPNNPTGTLYSEEEVGLIAETAIKHNLFVISDETYQDIVFDGKKVKTFYSLDQLRDRLIICDSVSKRFNSCGARVGVLVSKNQEVNQAVLRFAQGRLSVPTMEQLSMCAMLKNNKDYLEKIRTIYQKRRDVVVEKLKKIPGVSFQVPQGAFYIMPKIPVANTEEFAKFLLTDFSDNGETVMIAPAAGFYQTPGLGLDEIRIAYVLDEDRLKRGIELLGMAIEQYNKQ